MMHIMYTNNGIGLASPQIGRSCRIFVMNVGGEEYTCINPIILKFMPETNIDGEGCLSFPHLSLKVRRSTEIFVSYQNVNGQIMQKWIKGLVARCFQHELDHLNGITFDEHVAKLSLKMGNDKRRKIIKAERMKINNV